MIRNISSVTKKPNQTNKQNHLYYIFTSFALIDRQWGNLRLGNFFYQQHKPVWMNLRLNTLAATKKGAKTIYRVSKRVIVPLYMEASSLPVKGFKF